MTLVPTSRFWWLAAAGIPFAALAFTARAPLAVLAYDLGLVGIAYASARLGQDPRKVRVTRRHDAVLSVRRSNRVTLQIENLTRRPMAIQLRDEPPGLWKATGQEMTLMLPAGKLVERDYHVTPTERGAEQFQGTFIRVRCPLGLVVRQERLETEADVRVYPDVLALKEFGLLRQHGRLREMGIRRSRQRGQGTEFESLKAYTEGDDYRDLDWKASARHGEPIVRRHETEKNQAVIVALDLGRAMLAEVDGVVKLDRALDALLMLAQAAALAGDQIGLLAFDDQVRVWVPPAKGRAQVGNLIRAAHDLRAGVAASDPVGAFAELGAKWKRRALLVVFSDAEDEFTARPLAAALGPMSRRHRVVFCRVADPKLAAARKASLETVDGMYVRAAAALIHDDRRTAAGVLSGAGVRILEADPEELAAQLVATYLDARSEGI